MLPWHSLRLSEALSLWKVYYSSLSEVTLVNISACFPWAGRCCPLGHSWPADLQMALCPSGATSTGLSPSLASPSEWVRSAGPQYWELPPLIHAPKLWSCSDLWASGPGGIPGGPACAWLWAPASRGPGTWPCVPGAKPSQPMALPSWYQGVLLTQVFFQFYIICVMCMWNWKLFMLCIISGECCFLIHKVYTAISIAFT